MKHLDARAEAQSSWEAEASEGKRFKFGANWNRFLSVVDEDRVAEAMASLHAMLGVEDLGTRSFLDAGSGSGLFSLAATRMGARVLSFDYDPTSVACTKALRDRFASSTHDWIIEQGSILDEGFLARLGQFDVVYSWGVLHHTGAMWDALQNVSGLVAPSGYLFISIYNDQGPASVCWRAIKRFYCSGVVSRSIVLAAFIPYFLIRGVLVDLVKGKNPIRRHTEYKRQRGMSLIHDLVDWLGGYPFEVAKPEEIFDFLRSRGFVLQRLKTCGGGWGCNEYLFKSAALPH